jgi:signal peptidase I
VTDPIGSTPPPEPEAATHRPRVPRWAEWVLVVVGALVVAFVIQLTSLQAFSIPSESMLPTLHKGDRVLVNKWSYRLHDIHRGDVVVFDRPPEVTDTSVDDLIKRVVGLPGEQITIADGHVSVDGQVLEESYLPPGTRTDPTGPVTCPPEHPCVVPDDSIWVMGDNRSNSEDSRYFGTIPKSSVVGRASLRIWPLDRLDAL